MHLHCFRRFGTTLLLYFVLSLFEFLHCFLLYAPHPKRQQKRRSCRRYFYFKRKSSVLIAFIFLPSRFLPQNIFRTPSCRLPCGRRVPCNSMFSLFSVLCVCRRLSRPFSQSRLFCIFHSYLSRCKSHNRSRRLPFSI